MGTYRLVGRNPKNVIRPVWVDEFGNTFDTRTTIPPNIPDHPMGDDGHRATFWGRPISYDETWALCRLVRGCHDDVTARIARSIGVRLRVSGDPDAAHIVHEIETHIAYALERTTQLQKEVLAKAVRQRHSWDETPRSPASTKRANRR